MSVRLTDLFPVLLFILLTGAGTYAEESGNNPVIEQHGFVELRGGMRLQQDSMAKGVSVGELRLQYECSADWRGICIKYKGDLYGDIVKESVIYDTREAWLFFRVAEFADLKLGRQALSWGTGDLVFINDLFPKDWQSYYLGREPEYLKAPSDSLKLSLFFSCASVDIVYTPKFNSDRFVTGEYLSYWNSRESGYGGISRQIVDRKPDRFFSDDEIALRIYRTIGRSELAFYGYWGYWKNPAGETEDGVALFPALEVYGISLRTPVGKGIGNIEVGFYNSKEDSTGSNPLVRNSEIRYVVGYQQELIRDFNISLQYYGEYKLDYDNYLLTSGNGVKRDELRHVITFQFTGLLSNQTYELGLGGYYSPSDRDAYLRPYMSYKYSDNLFVKLGANIFIGAENYTFFGQLKNNTNIYLGVRYSI